jgi:hypothetical protein
VLLLSRSNWTYQWPHQGAKNSTCALVGCGGVYKGGFSRVDDVVEVGGCEIDYVACCCDCEGEEGCQSVYLGTHFGIVGSVGDGVET